MKKQVYWALAERRVLNEAKSVLFTSRNEMRLAERTFVPKAQYRARILPLGVQKSSAEGAQLREAFFQRFPIMRGRRYLLFLGRLDPKKGCGLLIEAVSRIRPPLDVVFAGPGADEAYKSKLARSAVGLPMFLGKWLRHAYYPNWNLRLFKHALGRFEQLVEGETDSGDVEIHEHVFVNGQTGRLRTELEHYAFPTVESFIEKHNRIFKLGSTACAGAERQEGRCAARA